MKSLYLVAEGEVSPATPETPWDGENSVLVLASSPEEALEVAKAYDAGLTGIDNVMIDGKPVAVAAFWR